MKQYLNVFFVTFLCVSFFGCARSTTDEKVYWDKVKLPQINGHSKRDYHVPGGVFDDS